GRESYDAGNGSAAGTDGSGESSEDGGEGESPVGLLLDGPGMEVAPEVEKLLHRMIKQVTGDLENLRFNTAISKMMIFVNELYKGQGRRFSRDQGERFVKVLSPFAPHLAEELWNKLGQASTVAYEPWPAYDPALCVEDTVEIVVQINGKIKGIIDIPRDASQEQVQGLVEQEQSLAEKLSGCEIRKVIYVRNRLVNYVV
ncbi:MAG: class I tRNA ligase family protein, partial [Firmicutes bacterium]|nr:class I tRNA ligase family protein [Bacillota bacterium]